jgi:hypothetical protein
MLNRLLATARVARVSPLPQVSLVRFSGPRWGGAGPRDDYSSMQIPVEHLAPSEWYIATNPLGRYFITPRGDIRKQISRLAASIAAISAVIAGLLAGLSAMASSPDPGSTPVRVTIYAIVFTGFVGLFAWLVLRAVSAVIAAYHIGKDRAEVYHRVHSHDVLAWRLCRVTEAVIRTDAWRDGTVDPSRQVAIISWSAIGRALTAARRLDDARRAAAHISLADIAEEALTKLEQEIEALEQIYLNLGRVLLSAKSVDEQRMAAEQRRKDRIVQRREESELRREESELRQKLTGNAPVLDLQDSFAEADRSAGTAAETAAIAQLLAQSDVLLRDVD